MKTLTFGHFLVFCLLLSSSKVALAVSGYVLDERQPPASVEEASEPLEETFTPETPPTSRFPGLKEKLQTQPPIWRDSVLGFKLRTYYFDRSRSPGPTSEAWALGGSLSYTSGWWRERLSFGGTAYTSQKLYGPEDKDGTLLLKPGQESFSVLGEAFVRLRLGEQTKMTLYRQTLDAPYVNKNDNRMAPNTFEAYTLANLTAERLRWGVSHVTKMKTRNSDEFISMSEAAGFKGTDKDLTMGGARYAFSQDANVGAITQYAWDFMNTVYAEGNWLWRRGERLPLRLSAQYTHQKSIGDEMGGDFSTYVAGGKVSGSYKSATLSIAFSSVSDDSSIRSPFGGYPGYLSLMIKDFNRADEDAWLVGFAYDFENVGLSGLSVFANYAEGNTPNRGDNASPDQSEIDVTLDYRFLSGLLEGLWLRLRWAKVEQDNDVNGAVDTSDVRVIANYEVPIL